MTTSREGNIILTHPISKESLRWRVTPSNPSHKRKIRKEE